MHPLRKLRESGKSTPTQVSELLAENIVCNSPILVRPIQGREVIAAIFAQSSATRGSGTYTAEFKLDERTTFLRWVRTMDGHKFESMEIIVNNEQVYYQTARKDDPNTLLFFAVFGSQDAYHSHLQQEHAKKTFAAFQGKLAEEPVRTELIELD